MCVCVHVCVCVCMCVCVCVIGAQFNRATSSMYLVDGVEGIVEGMGRSLEGTAAIRQRRQRDVVQNKTITESHCHFQGLLMLTKHWSVSKAFITLQFKVYRTKLMKYQEELKCECVCIMTGHHKVAPHTHYIILRL